MVEAEGKADETSRQLQDRSNSPELLWDHRNGKACTERPKTTWGTPCQHAQDMAPATWPPSSSTGYASRGAAISCHPEALLLRGAVIYGDELFNVVFGASVALWRIH